MSKWPTLLLGEVCSFVRGPFGGSLKKSIFKADGFAVYEQQHAIGDQFENIRYFIDAGKFDEMKRFELKPEDLIMSCSGTIGKTAIVPNNVKRGIINQALLKLTPAAELNVKFLQLWMRSPIFQSELKTLTLGAAIKNVASVKVLKNLRIQVPSITEQERIVGLLDEAEGLRQLRQQADQKTAQLIPALFHQMFGNSDTWPVEQLNSLCERVTVGHVGPMSNEYKPSGIPFLRGQNVKRGRLELSNVLYISNEFNEKLKKSALRPNDVISVRTGKPGVTSVVPTNLPEANCADLIIMTCGPKLHPNYLSEFLNQRLGDKDEIEGAVGIAQKHFNIGTARKLSLPLPPINLQTEFANRVAEIREMETAQAQSRTRLDDAFQSLLHRAFNGEL